MGGRDPRELFAVEKSLRVRRFAGKHRWRGVVPRNEIDDEHWTHVIVDRASGRCVRVIDAADDWGPEQIEASLVG